MSIKEIMEKVSGKQFCCAGGCCGENCTRTMKESDSFGFDLILIIRLLVSAVVFAAALVVSEIPEPWPVVMLIAAAVICGYDMIASAVLAIMDGRYFDKRTLMIVVSVIAFIIDMPTEGAAIILLFQLGNSIVDYAFMRTCQNVIDTVACDAENAHVLREGAEEIVSAQIVALGDHIIIYPGEIVPCDGIILEGSGSLDISPLGGGDEILFVSEGDELLSGSINVNGTLRCEVTAVQADSAAAAMLKSVRKAADSGSPLPKAVTRFQELYTPVMVVLAVIIAGVLPLIYKFAIKYAIKRAIIFLVVANPCAMFVALPLIYFCAIGRSAKKGVLFSSNTILEKAAHPTSVAFEKAGTLTDGNPRVISVKSERIDADTFLKITAHALSYSDSPISKAVISSYGGTIYIELIENFLEIPDKGVEVYVDGVRICAGNLALMEEKAIVIPESDIAEEQAIYVSLAKEYAGRILLAESLREDAVSSVAELGRQGVDSVILITDDQALTAAKTASDLKIKEYYSGCGRDQTIATVEEIRRSMQGKNALMFVKSEKWDSSGRTAADIDVTISDTQALSTPMSSDILIFNGKISGIVSAVSTAKYAQMFSYGTIAAALLVKLVIMVLAFLGIATLWFAVFIDSAAALGTILFAIRVLTTEPKNGGLKKLIKH